MTFRGLLDALEAAVKAELGTMQLPVKQEGWDDQPLSRDVEIFKQKVPPVTDVEQKIPYILLQIVNGVDDVDSNGKNENTVSVRMVITIYDEDPDQGRLAAQNIVERLRVGLQRRGVIGKRFELTKPFEYAFYVDDTALYNPYHQAEIMTKWKIPPVKRQMSPYDW